MPEMSASKKRKSSFRVIGASLIQSGMIFNGVEYTPEQVDAINAIRRERKIELPAVEVFRAGCPQAPRNI